MNRKEYLLILVATFVVVMIWVASNIYYARSETNIPSDVASSLGDVDPNFDQTTLDRIKKLSPLPTSSIPQPILHPTPITPTQESSSSPNFASPTSSVSGTSTP